CVVSRPSPFLPLCLRRRCRLAALLPYTTLFRSCGLMPRMCAETSSAERVQSIRASAVVSFAAWVAAAWSCGVRVAVPSSSRTTRSEEHTSELQSRFDLVCRLLLGKTNVQWNTHA